MKLSETCIRRPVLTTLLTASIIVLGVFAYRLLAVAALPAVDFPTINIIGQLPGASPETMAASVASPIERQLSTIAGITSLTSSSSLGITSITIQFDLNRNIDGAALDVQTALSVAARKLPVEMTIPPAFRKVNPGDFPILYISLNSQTQPLHVVDEYGEVEGLVTLEDILEEIVGDITDEHDVAMPGVRKQPDGSVNVDGAVPIRDLNRVMEWNLPDEEATTIAGLVIHEARTIPEVGQSFTFHGFRFRVLRRARNRITALRIQPVARRSVAKAG